MKDYETLSGGITYNGIVFDVKVDTISLPNGKTTLRETVVHSGGAAIVPIDGEGNVYFVRQYRHAAQGMLLEIPAGKLEKGEDPLVCASRELEEEIGMKSDDITLITAMYATVGYSSEVIHIYRAENLYAGMQHLDDDEFVSVEKYPLAKAVEMIFSGEIVDSKTIVGILACRK